MLNKEKVLQYYFIQAIKETIYQEMNDTDDSIQKIEEYNLTFSDRVISNFIQSVPSPISIEDSLLFIKSILEKKTK